MLNTFPLETGRPIRVNDKNNNSNNANNESLGFLPYMEAEKGELNIKYFVLLE
jgi:hypothetical protein